MSTSAYHTCTKLDVLTSRLTSESELQRTQGSKSSSQRKKFVNTFWETSVVFHKLSSPGFEAWSVAILDKFMMIRNLLVFIHILPVPVLNFISNTVES